METPRPAQYSLQDFLQWRKGSSLEISPKFQRRGVWTPTQRSYFIDTLLREMPSPPIYLRNIYDLDKQSVIHEVIDGQQRLRAVLDFYDGKYAMSSNLEAEEWRGLRYNKLSKPQQLRVLKYKFSTETFENITDREVFEVFRRMNTYSTPLTPQELRHGNYFGPFRETCEGLALDHLEFWKDNKVVSDRQITRMLEVQLTSALLIAQIAGMQDKTKIITEFYEKYDNKFPGKSLHEKRFRQTIDQITETFGDSLRDSQFRRTPYFYTLFCVVFHRAFGLPKSIRPDGETPEAAKKFKLPSTPKKPLSPKERDSLKSASAKLSDVIEKAKARQKVEGDRETTLNFPARFEPFAAASLSQTDNLAPRQERFSTLYEEAFG